MGRFTGFRCDQDGTVAEGTGREKNGTPTGWITVSITTPADQTPGTFLFCSSKCIKKWATERVKAETEEARPSPSKPAGDVAKRVKDDVFLRQQNHVRHHTNGTIDPNCLYCEVPEGTT
jgi:hypothetical protein